MPIANCVRCSVMFQKLMGQKVCAACLEEDERSYQVVYDYLEGHPASPIPVIAEATGLEPSVILKLLQGGRFSTLGDLANGIKGDCNQCGKPSSGRYCDPCLEGMSAAFRQSARDLGQEAKHVGRVRRPETLSEKRKR